MGGFFLNPLDRERPFCPERETILRFYAAHVRSRCHFYGLRFFTCFFGDFFFKRRHLVLWMDCDVICLYVVCVNGFLLAILLLCCVECGITIELYVLELILRVADLGGAQNRSSAERIWRNGRCIVQRRRFIYVMLLRIRCCFFVWVIRR